MDEFPINLPLLAIGAAVGSITSEFISPHMYGLSFLDSMTLEVGGGKKLHFHHWMWAGLGLGVMGFIHPKNKWVNSLLTGTLIGVFAQGLSYSTSHWIIYDEDEFNRARWEGSYDNS